MKVSPINYLHPDDRAAMDKLKAIPLFSTCVKGFLKIGLENLLLGTSMAQKIKLGPEQLPHIYNYLPPVCEKLDIQEPEFFLEMNPVPNAYTYGDSKVFLTITSGLLEYMDEGEIKAVIAHECGHIACRHVLYHTMADFLLRFGAGVFGPVAAVSMPVRIALLYWHRRSELSADRAAAIYMDGPDEIVDTMIRLSGGPKSLTENINIELYKQQAESYNAMLEESMWNTVLQGYAIMSSNHPFATVRTKEILDWCHSEQFQLIMATVKGEKGVSRCPACNNIVEELWQFCMHCGQKLAE